MIEGSLMNVLQELLGDFDIDDFMNDYFFQQPFAAPYNAKRFEGLLDWDLLKDVLKVHHDCWLPRNGKLPEAKEFSRGVLSFEQAQICFQLGHTLLIRHAERADKRLAQVAGEFHQLFDAPIDIQLYATPKEEEGFDWHYDVEDVFVLQSHGEKEFRLVPNTTSPRPLPMMSKDNMNFSKEKSPEIRCWLKAGDWLYIPAGYWHKAKALTDSFHLSVGVLCQRPVVAEKPHKAETAYQPWL